MFNLTEKGKSMDNVTTVGIDLAKNVFFLHGVGGQVREVWRRTVRRGQLLAVVARLPRCRIGMEACSGAHQWAREFQALGREVKLMAPKFVAPYRRGGKNDGNDTEAICEAVSRPTMRFVPVKSAEAAGGAESAPGASGLRGGAHGDPYLRTLLIMGARVVLQAASRRQDRLSHWALSVRERRGYHRACVAIAAKNARIVWALLAKDEPLRAAMA